MRDTCRSARNLNSFQKKFAERISVVAKGGRLIFTLVGDNLAKPAGAIATDAERLVMFNASELNRSKTNGAHFGR
jgi:hypothetical protein